MAERAHLIRLLTIVAWTGLAAATASPPRALAVPPFGPTGTVRITHVAHGGAICPEGAHVTLRSDGQAARLELGSVLRAADLIEVNHWIAWSCSVALDIDITAGYGLRKVSVAAPFKTVLRGGASYVVAIDHGLEESVVGGPTGVKSVEAGEDALTLASDRWMRTPCSSRLRYYVRLDAHLFRALPDEGTPLFGEVTFDHLDIDLAPLGLGVCSTSP